MNYLLLLYVNMQAKLQAKMKEEHGASMVEYALMIALVATVVFGAVKVFGGLINGLFVNANTKLRF